MRDLAGVDDSDDGFAEIDVLTDQHVRETAERAVRTRRGTIREFPERYVDLAGYIEARSADVPTTVIASLAEDDLEADSRIRRASVTIQPPNPMGRVAFRIELTMSDGTVLDAEGSV